MAQLTSSLKPPAGFSRRDFLRGSGAVAAASALHQQAAAAAQEAKGTAVVAGVAGFARGDRENDRGEGDAHGEGHHLTVDHGEDARIAEADRADGGVRLGPEDDGTAAERLALRPELAVDLEPDHGLKRGSRHLPKSSGPR